MKLSAQRVDDLKARATETSCVCTARVASWPPPLWPASPERDRPRTSDTRRDAGWVL